MSLYYPIRGLDNPYNSKIFNFFNFFNFVPFSDQVTDHFPLNSVLVQFLTLTHDEKARC